ncbi:MAG TPA: N-acetylmuramoyl-L-alanine amidase [Gemmatimonadales bacterium]|nr:N-acetylmuramoyl-L-alanine amidase [Gemmatimonadales bacterium]
MIAALALLAVLAGGVAPRAITVSTLHGDQRVPVRSDRGGSPLVSAPLLVSALGGTVTVGETWVEVTLADQGFRFLLGAPLYLFNNQLQSLAAPILVVRDTIYLPFQFVAEALPTFLSERYHYDRRSARLVEERGRLLAARPAAGRLPNGLRPGHLVTVDAGHGGVDPGNPGMFFPRGLREKDVTLAVAMLLRDELRRRGVTVRMTRTTDTLIALGERGGYCTEKCDLFVSLHVNSLPRRRGFTDIRGFETYFLAEARTEDAARVARMENEAVRFENVGDGATPLGAIDFIVKDLQLNEHLRESARLAELMQRDLGQVHSGPDLGVKQAGFMVLTTARRPAVLVEMGYSTNRDDSTFLTSTSGQRAIASSVADAVVDYLLEYERKTDAAADSGTAR